MAISNRRLTSKLAIGLFAAIAIDTLLQLAWKTTVLEMAADASPLTTPGTVFANPAFFGVLFLMAIQFFNWLIVLSQADLSYVKPISSLSYASAPSSRRWHWVRPSMVFRLWVWHVLLLASG